jgi:hypothetical protein
LGKYYIIIRLILSMILFMVHFVYRTYESVIYDGFHEIYVLLSYCITKLLNRHFHLCRYSLVGFRRFCDVLDEIGYIYVSSKLG